MILMKSMVGVKKVHYSESPYECHGGISHHIQNVRGKFFSVSLHKAL